jgi:hypothetical protein
MDKQASQAHNNRYLLDYRKDVASQFGEDGILEKIFQIVPTLNKWCVEFGAWDGEHFSNTYNLLKNRGWSGVPIEGDKAKYKDLMATYADNKKVIPLSALVDIEGPNSLDNLLSKTPIPKDFDLLSIDIDGNDYHVWKALVKYTPKVVIIEFNAFIPENIEFVQPADVNVKQGNSILSMTKLANEKGYELVCINQENAIYVDKKYFALFRIGDNSIGALKHFREPLQVYQLYDGTFRFHGAHCLYYFGFKVDLNRRFQILPKWLRDAAVLWDTKKSSSFWYTTILRFYRRINRIKSIDDSNDHDCWGWKSRY